MTFTKEETESSNYFLSQPHQPFFVLGITNAVVMMLIFALSYKGIFNLHVDTLTFHVYSIIFLLFTNVFTGFLFTTFPKFCQTETISEEYYRRVFFINIVATLLFIVGSFISIKIVALGMAAAFISQSSATLMLRAIHNNGGSLDKKDSFWMLNALYFGLFGNLLFILSIIIPDILSLAINSSFYMYLIFLTFTVAQRMIPFFSHSFEEKNANFIRTVFILFILKTIMATLDHSSIVKMAEVILNLALAAYLTLEFLRWKMTPFSSPPIVWVLHLALFWLPAALIVDAMALTAEIYLETSFYFLGLHLVAIGFLTTMLIGFGTRVTLAHSGQPPHADKFATGVFLFIQAVVLLRALYSLNVAFGWGAEFLFDISFTAWLLLFIVWAWRYAKVLIFGTRL